MMRMRRRTTTTTMTTGTRGMESREKLAAVVPSREGSSSGGFVGPVPVHIILVDLALFLCLENKNDQLYAIPATVA